MMSRALKYRAVYECTARIAFTLAPFFDRFSRCPRRVSGVRTTPRFWVKVALYFNLSDERRKHILVVITRRYSKDHHIAKQDTQ